MPSDRTIIDEFESVLGVPFDSRWTKEIKIDVPTARLLAEAVKRHYLNFRLPEKGLGEMRPYIFHSYTAGNKPWHDFVEFEGASYSFQSSPDKDMELYIKPYLLYSHGVCFYDPLPGLLDYFRPSSKIDDYEKARIPGLRILLFEYVKIADLVRRNIVVPIADEFFGLYSHNQFFLSKDEESAVLESLKKFPDFGVGDKDTHLMVGRFVKEQIWLNQRAENRMDLYFPRDFYVSVLQGLYNAASRRYSSKDISEPFAVGMIANLAKIDTSKLSIRDIISIRSEDVFDEYRNVLKGILRRLQENAGKFSDFETEFAVAAREEMASCDEMIKKLTKKSNVLKDTLSNLDRVLIGGATGALGGVIAGSPSLAVLGAAAGAAARPLYDILRGAWTTAPGAAGASLRNHFLVLDPTRTA